MLSDAQRARLAARLRSGAGAPAAGRRAGGPTGGEGPLVDLSGAAAGAAAPPLFAVHAIGGTVYAYAPLARELAPAYRLHGVQADGLHPGSTPATSLAAMVARYAEAIRSARPGGPYLLAGWSMGGQIGYEIAVRLASLGERVDLLVLVDTPFPEPAAAAGPAPSEPALAKWFAADAGFTLGWTTGDIAALDGPAGADPLGWLAGRLSTGGVDPEGVRADLGRRFAVFAAHARVMAGYRPTARLAAPAVIADSARSPDWAAGWANLVDGPVRTTRLPGMHYGLLQPPAVTELAAAILAARPAAG